MEGDKKFEKLGMIKCQPNHHREEQKLPIQEQAAFVEDEGLQVDDQNDDRSERSQSESHSQNGSSEKPESAQKQISPVWILIWAPAAENLSNFAEAFEFVNNPPIEQIEEEKHNFFDIRQDKE